MEEMNRQPSKQNVTPQSGRRKNTAGLGKFSTEQERIAELRTKAFARDGRNALIARAILKEFDRPLKQRESDRALGRRLGVDHRTIGRWRERIKGQRPRHRVVSRRKFLGLCQTLRKLNVAVMSQKILPKDIRSHVVPACEALHRFRFGAKTLPQRRGQAAQA
jgi:hypothetical protein